MRNLCSPIALNQIDVVLGLQIEPELSGIPEVTTQPDGGIGCNRAAAVKNVRDAPRGDAKIEREPTGAQFPGLQFALQNPSWVNERCHHLSLVLIGEFHVVSAPRADHGKDVVRVAEKGKRRDDIFTGSRPPGWTVRCDRPEDGLSLWLKRRYIVPVLASGVKKTRLARRHLVQSALSSLKNVGVIAREFRNAPGVCRA